VRRFASITLLFSIALANGLGASAPRKPDITRLKVPVLAAANVAVTSGNIQATVAGAPAKVVAVASPSDDLILMLVLDLAGDLTLAERAKSALLSEFEQSPKRLHVALLRAQDGLRVIQDPGQDLSRVKPAIESLSVTGRAGLLDSIETAAAIADSILSKSAVRVAVLYITDSDVKNYRQDFTNPVINSSDAGDLSRKFPEALIQEKISKVNANLARTQAPVFIVQINYLTDRLNEAYMNGLRQLATTTGASAILCRSSVEIPAAIGGMLGTIRDHYSVTLEVPRVNARSVDVKLTVSDSEGSPQDVGYRSRFDLKKD
jgi:hypothetical protein